MFDIKINFNATIRGLDNISRKQVPFATAKSLTQLAKIAQGQERQHLDRVFNIRAERWIKRNIRITPAKKSDARKDRAFSAVRTDPRLTNVLVGHETGETRKAKGGKKLSVPRKALLAMDPRSAFGRIKKKFREPTLLKHFRGSRGLRGPRVKTTRRRPFIIQSKYGNSVIVRRAGKDKLPLIKLYSFEKKLKVKKKWGFEKVAKKSVKQRWKLIFENNLNHAIKTAR